MKAKNKVKSEKQGVRFLITMLLRYPMIDSVDFNLKKRQLIMTFFLEKKPKEKIFEEKVSRFSKSLKCYNEIKEEKQEEFKIKIADKKDISRIDLYYEIFSLTQKKLDFIIKLVMDVFEKEVYIDRFNFEQSDETESLDDLLLMIKKNEKKIGDFMYLAFREEDRIMLFNKK